MNKEFEHLIGLSQLNQDISEIKSQISNHEKVLKKSANKIENIKNDIETTKENIVNTQQNVSKNNTHLKDLSTQLKDITKKSKKAKTQKEVNAVQIEEDIAKSSISFTNDEITRLQNIIELKKSQNKEKQEELKIEKKLFDKLSKSIKGEIKELNTKINEIKKQKTALAKYVDKKLLNFYGNIQRWAKETAVVKVKNKACYGCFMKISNKTYNLLKLGNDINVCDSCGRIIYIEKNID